MVQRYALVGTDNLVAQIEETQFEVAKPFRWLKCSDTVKTGDIWTGVTFIAYDDFAVLRAAKLSQLSDVRKSKEKGGVIFAGVTFASDVEGQTKVKIARDALNEGLMQSVDWSGENGWKTFDAGTFNIFALGLMSFVQQCFSVQKFHDEHISAITDRVELAIYSIETGWPSNVIG